MKHKHASTDAQQMKTAFSLLVALVFLPAPGAHGAGWLERLGFGRKPATNQPAAVAAAALSQDQMVGGLKAALGKGVEHAVASLGKPDGFLKDLSVKIPLPAPLTRVESSLRMLRQEQWADDFVATMNRAAEQAVPEAAAVLGNSVKQMSIADAKAILTGTNNAATQYFRRTSETNLYERFLPIVAKATERTGVTSAYKQMLSKASFAGSLLGPDAGNLDAYIAHKTLDGLFVKIADEEKRIRENPVARTTGLLQTVFGAVQK
jgi:hypothetical protein